MKKLLCILFALFVGFSVNAQDAWKSQKTPNMQNLNKKEVNALFQRANSKSVTQKAKMLEGISKWENSATISELSKNDAKVEKVKQTQSSFKMQEANIGQREMENTQSFTRANTSRAFILNEDFESVEPGTLPIDWTTIATPNGGEAWETGTVGYEDDYGDFIPTPGHSGWQYAYMLYHSTMAHDAWLFTPALSLTQGKSYAISFWVQLQGYAGTFEAMEAKIGTSATVAGMTTQIYNCNNQSHTTWQEVTYRFTPTTTGTYYIGFHSYSPADVNSTLLDDVTVLELYDIDAEITSISTPVSGVNLTDAEAVTATIKNNGVSAITGFTLELNVNGSVVATETYTGSIAAGEQANYTFTATADLSAAGSHAITVTANLTGDEDAANNSQAINVTNTICDVISNFPWTEGFEDFTIGSNCWRVENLSGTGWRINTNASYVRGTQSIYHADVSGDQDSWLITPPIAIPTGANYTLKFWYNSYYASFYTGGTNNGNGRNSVLISTANGAAGHTDFVEIWSPASIANDTWVEISLPLSSYAGEEIYIAFRYEGTYAHQWYVDDVSIMDFSNYADAEVVSITTPISGLDLGDETVTAVIKNNGSAPITNFDLSFDINGADVVTETYTGTIASLSQVEYTFTATADLSAAGNHTLRVYTSLTDDQNPANDTATITITNTVCDAITSFPWEENFTDGISACWLNIDNDEDGEAWYTGTLDGNPIVYSESYSEGALTPDNWLITKQIILDDSYSLLFDVGAANTQYYAEKYSVLVSTTGTDIEDFTEIHTEILTEMDMKTVGLSLADYEGESIYIAFRHWDCTDQLAFFLDNIRILDFTDIVETQVVSITTPTSGINLSDEEIVTAIIRNNGSDPITNFDISFDVNGANVITETYTGTIASLGRAEYTFTATADLSAAGDYTIRVYTSLTDDQNSANDTATITVTNIICDAITTFPWEENFTNELSACWLNIDNDGDGYDWGLGTLDGDPCIASNSAIPFIMGLFIPLTPDDWLITPQIVLDDAYSLFFDIGAIQGRHLENFSVLISTTGTELSDFTEIHTETLTEGGMKTVALNLADYEGESIYIAFRHWDCTDQYVLILDNIKIMDISGVVDAAVTSISSPSSGINLGNEAVKVMVKNNGGSDITGFTLTLNVNGTNVATETYTGTIASLSQAEYTFTATADLSAAGSHTIKVTVNLTDDEVADNNSTEITVTNAICNQAISTFPWSDDFQTGQGCWEVRQQNTNQTWQYGILPSDDPAPTDAGIFIDYDDALGQQDEYIVSPEFNFTNALTSAPMTFSFYFSMSYYWSVDPEDNYDLYFKATTDGQNWISLWDESMFGTFDNFTMNQVTVDIAQFANQPSVRFAFQYVGLDGAAAYIDNVAIDATIGTNDITTDNINMYPNPADGTVNLTNLPHNSTVTVFDLTGRMLSSYNNVTSSLTMDVRFAAGAYIVKIENENNVAIKKLIVK